MKNISHIGKFKKQPEIAKIRKLEESEKIEQPITLSIIMDCVPNLQKKIDVLGIQSKYFFGINDS